MVLKGVIFGYLISFMNKDFNCEVFLYEVSRFIVVVNLMFWEMRLVGLLFIGFFFLLGVGLLGVRGLCWWCCWWFFSVFFRWVVILMISLLGCLNGFVWGFGLVFNCDVEGDWV